MISEALSLGIRPIIYKHEAMRPASHTYIAQLKQEGRILEYPDDLNTEYCAQKPVENQINIIVRSLEEILCR